MQAISALLIAVACSAAGCASAASRGRSAAGDTRLSGVSERSDTTLLEQTSAHRGTAVFFSLADLPRDDPAPLGTWFIPTPTLRDGQRGEIGIAHNDQTLVFSYGPSGAIQDASFVSCQRSGHALNDKRAYWQTEGLRFASGGGLVWEIAKGFYNPVDCKLHTASHTWTTLHELVPELVWGAIRAVDAGHEVTLIVPEAVSVVTSHELGPDARVTMRLGTTLGPQSFARVTLPLKRSWPHVAIEALLVQGSAKDKRTLVSIELNGSEGVVFSAGVPADTPKGG